MADQVLGVNREGNTTATESTQLYNSSIAPIQLQANHVSSTLMRPLAYLIKQYVIQFGSISEELYDPESKSIVGGVDVDLKEMLVEFEFGTALAGNSATQAIPALLELIQYAGSIPGLTEKLDIAQAIKDAYAQIVNIPLIRDNQENGNESTTDATTPTG